MRSFDLTPLLRSSIGFDDLFRMTESLARTDQSSQGYPPYNIAKVGDDEYRIELAVAGFAPEDIDLVVQDRTLTVTGRTNEREDGVEYLHRGIAKRAFERQFRLADTVKVTGARYHDGLLVIELKREIPEHMRPRKIRIEASASPTTIESRAKEETAEARHVTEEGAASADKAA